MPKTVHTEVRLLRHSSSMKPEIRADICPKVEIAQATFYK